MKHTPGPWEQFPPGTIVANPDQCVIKRREDFDWIASVQISNIPNWEANAALIAKAPEMHEELIRLRQDKAELLEACEYVVSWLEDAKVHKDIVCNVQAAIAKAQNTLADAAKP